MISRLRERYRQLHDLQDWRDWLIDTLSLIYVVFFPLAVIPLIPRYLDQEHYVIIAVDLLVWLVLLIRVFIPPLGYRFRRFFWVAMLFLMSCAFTVSLGPGYARPVWMAVSVVMAAIFYGARGALVTVALNALFLGALYFLTDPSDPSWEQAHADGPANWLTYIVNSSLLMLMIGLTVGLLIARLGTSLDRERRGREELMAANEELEATNEEFEAQNEELIRSEAELQKKESFIRRIMENAPAVVYRISLNTFRIEYMNARATELIGRENDGTLTGRDIFNLTIPDDWKDTLRNYWKDIARGTDVPVIRYPILRDGASRRWIEHRSVLVRDEGGAPVAVEVFCTDITGEMESQKAVMASEEKYRGLVETIGEALYSVDERGIITYMSPGVRHFGGLKPEDCVNRPFIEFIHPDDRERLLRRFVELAEGKEVPADYRILIPSGGWHWIQSSSRARYEGGRFVGVTGMLTDIHERRVMEEELRRSRSTLESMVNALPDPAFLLDDERNFLAVNDACAARLGARAGDLNGTRATERIAPLLAGEGEGLIDRSFEEGTPFVFESEHGERFYVNYIYPALDETGRVIRIAFFSLDISDRRSAEAILLQEKKFISTVMNTLPGIFFMLDEDGSFIRWKGMGTGSAFFGYTDEEIWTMHARDIIEESGRDAFSEKVRQVFDEGAGSIEAAIQSRNGEKRIYLISATRMALEGGRFFIAIGVDITDIKEAEVDRERTRMQLMQAQKMEAVGTLAGGIAHDFNNMLGGIMGSVNMVELLLRDEQGESSREMVDRYLETALASCRRAADMTKQLLTISRKSELKLLPVDIALSMGHVRRLSENSFPKSIILDFPIPAAPLMVRADPVQIEQVLLNLCLNAVHAMTIMRPPGERHGGTLRVEADEASFDVPPHPDARPDLPYVRVRVNDTGVGMDDETRQHIFDPFFTTKMLDQGTGLGLAMVYSIVSRHEGFIDVESSPGKGSTFTIYVPAIDRDTVREPLRKDAAIQRGSGTILVIDDEKAILRIARGMLEHCGYRVLTADNVRDAVDIYGAEMRAIDGVLLDLSMPGVSGFEVFDRLAELNPGVKVLLSSGLIDEDELSLAKRKGVLGFLQKPYTAEELSVKIGEILA